MYEFFSSVYVQACLGMPNVVPNNEPALSQEWVKP